MGTDPIDATSVVGFVCQTCWLVFAASAPACAGCGTAMPATGWPTLPYEFRQRYVFVSQLGRGGMGAVFCAYDRQASEQPWVAVKVAQLKGDAAMRRSLEGCFRSEGSAAGMLSQHAENFVGFRGSDFSEPACLILDFVDWPTLKGLRGSSILAPLEVAQIGIKVLSGIRFMERRRMVHRDLKPENIFVRRRGGDFDAKIADFGVWVDSGEAYETTLLGQAGNGLAGTPQYMSPEQTRGEVITTASDLHMLGSILWELATGVVPFPFRPTADVMSALADRYERMRRAPEKPADMPVGLYKILIIALGFDAADRVHPELESPTLEGTTGPDASAARRLQKALQNFAKEYVEQNEREQKAFLASVDALTRAVLKVEDKLGVATELVARAAPLRQRIKTLTEDPSRSGAARASLPSLTIDVRNLETEAERVFEDQALKERMEELQRQVERHQTAAENATKRALDAEKTVQQGAHKSTQRVGTIALGSALAGGLLGALLLYVLAPISLTAGVDSQAQADAATDISVSTTSPSTATGSSSRTSTISPASTSLHEPDQDPQMTATPGKVKSSAPIPAPTVGASAAPSVSEPAAAPKDNKKPPHPNATGGVLAAPGVSEAPAAPKDDKKLPRPGDSARSL